MWLAVYSYRAVLVKQRIGRMDWEALEIYLILYLLTCRQEAWAQLIYKLRFLSRDSMPNLLILSSNIQVGTLEIQKIMFTRYTEII